MNDQAQAAVPQGTENKPTPVRDVKLRYGGLRLADEQFNRWGAILEAHQTMEDVVNPAFWSICAKRIRPHSIIDIHTEDGRFYTEAYVTRATNDAVHLKILRHYDLQANDEAEPETEYYYKWMGPSWGHCVVRKGDDMVVAKQLGDKGEAMEWIANEAQAA